MERRVSEGIGIARQRLSGALWWITSRESRRNHVRAAVARRVSAVTRSAKTQTTNSSESPAPQSSSQNAGESIDPTCACEPSASVLWTCAAETFASFPAGTSSVFIACIERSPATTATTLPSESSSARIVRPLVVSARRRRLRDMGGSVDMLGWEAPEQAANQSPAVSRPVGRVRSARRSSAGTQSKDRIADRYSCSGC